jgi:uncharacterized protein (TIGR02599 family)
MNVPLPQSRAPGQPQARSAFTLVEVLVSMVILAMMMLIITSVIGQAQKSWRAASSRVTQFREARQAFDTVTRNLRQATINSYRDYYYGGGTHAPSTMLEPPAGIKVWAELGIKFDRASQMVNGVGGAVNLPGHAVMFQAPLGKTAQALYDPLKNLLCARGYFVMFGSDSDYLPRKLAARLQPRYRYRLMEYQPNTENNSVYGPTLGEWTSIDYSKEQNVIHPVAENVVVMALGATFVTTQTNSNSTPDLASDSTNQIEFKYDSYVEGGGLGTAYRLPRSVQVVMVAIDEESASRMAQQMGNAAPNFAGAAGASFTNPTSLKDDLEKLTRYMQEKRMNYRVFSSSVLIMAAGGA